MEGDCLVSKIVAFEIDVGPDWELVQITNDFCDAGVLGYKTYSVCRGLGYDACESFVFSADF